MDLKTPVAFLVFNRPECTARVFAAIRTARPPRLFVVADGPRPSRPEDLVRCAEVRRIIDEGVDWPCVVERNYAETNLGCARRVASGLNWAFSRSERLIVLEDDCLPDQSFFEFCDELLERYANDDRVGQICGCPRYFSRVDRYGDSYLFSRYGPIWGWASWRRAWQTYDLEMKSWPEFKASGRLAEILVSRREFERRTALYDELFSKPPTTWDYQWGYAKISNRLLSVIPTRNLIENIGFAGDGTHISDGAFELTSGPVQFPLRHPSTVAVDEQFDRAYANEFAPSRSFPIRAARKLVRLLRRKFSHAQN